MGVLPAVDVGKSVSRVGGKAQRPGYRAVAGALKLAYAQFEELENFSRFGTKLDAEAQKSIDHGLRIRACLKQHESRPIPVLEQLVVLLALTTGLFDSVALEKMSPAEEAIQKACDNVPEELTARIQSLDEWSEQDRKQLLDIARLALKPFMSSP